MMGFKKRAINMKKGRKRKEKPLGMDFVMIIRFLTNN
jgi:hypothetical protein